MIKIENSNICLPSTQKSIHKTEIQKLKRVAFETKFQKHISSSTRLKFILKHKTTTA